MRLCVIIPTFNESKAIGRVVGQIKEQRLDVLVIDDGSYDDTFGIAAKNGAVVLRNEKNQGKGASLIRGFDYARQNGFDAVVTMDGDGQHLPEDIPLFLRAAQESPAGMVVGNRMTRTSKMPYIRVLTNRFMSWLISLVAGQKIPDSQCGFRLIKKELLDKMQLKTAKYEIESEMLIKASRLGFKIVAVPVKTVYAGERSHINPFIDTLRFIRFITGELWSSRS